ncbi:alpha-galactosidase [Dysgonomonas sp. PFB1-18]|uniref:alpha-galactosidase n=1 Tax=unclassified Dysgonomonas TaxID=2630389 RepID=UPI0024758E90|nr:MULTISPECIES: alpha-galactosidase [unclassified Dysgonomonas]MDH6310969.1 alpha-galactosidase [Dysgonomonas sp. PF1-14]MDH6340816.1 alpha-galactosidase [Dysgonomonas sp. PF1-16]MDH6382398.1 alpha-galactosidase [Dysgonomonas sp. PFB1-18]MDH6399785.1 alpha-galactosidase [Dysgonomonas sp. PF1-23]
MKKIILSLCAFSICIVLFGQGATEIKRFQIATDNSCLTLMVGSDNYLYQLGYGKPNAEFVIPPRGFSREKEFYPASGNGFIAEPALEANHADGNTSTDLYYQSHETKQLDADVEQTVIHLKDPQYPFHVDIFIKAYKKEDILEMWTEIYHEENGDVLLYKYASVAPIFSAKNYWLTQFNGNYKREATLVEEKLSSGIKILDSKIGVRAHQMRIPSFILSLNQAANEESGEVYISSLSWPGSFQLAFDIDWNNNLRALSGINPFGAKYTLEKGKKFQTPVSVWTYSNLGKGHASRNLHKWAVKYGIRDGKKERPILLNNWEATHCDFDEKKIVSLFDGAKDVGIELFLLDDGWFGNGKYARDDDKHGLGDWDPDKKKLPSGISYLCKEAEKRKIGFGIWLEPEMVNPLSELYEKHPDWVITQPKRAPLYGRYQLILDLTRPEVQQYEWNEVIDKTLKPNPGISYVKWDANRYVTQPGSSYLPAGKQSHLLTDYNWALLDLMKKTAANYPNVMMMLCAGGSGRTDYGSMKHFHSFWPSDNTDPLKRVYIQWGFSHIFPANAISAHVTRMGKRPMKFTIDVALSGAYGVDLDLSKLTKEEIGQIKSSIELYKTSLRPVIQYGELYRLSSPYEKSSASLSYVSQDKNKAVVFVYQVKNGENGMIKLKGLDSSAKYTVKELNLETGKKSLFALDGKVMTGKELMETGFMPVCKNELESMVIGLNVN